MAGEVRAETIGRAAATDLQIAVPVHPAVRRGVRLRRVSDAVLLDGSDRPQRFTGRFADAHLLGLAAACDGSRDHAALAEVTGLTESAVYKALALLWASGLVEEAPLDPPPALPATVATLLSRLGNTTGADRSWTDSAARLAKSTVALRGDADAVAATAQALDGLGIALDTAPVPGDPPRDLVVCFEGADTASTETLAAACWDAGQPMLRVQLGRERVRIGPWVDSAFTPCLECACAVEPDPAAGPPASAAELSLIAGLVAHHLVAVLSRSTMTHLPLDTADVELAELSTTYRAAASRPGCPRCSAASGPSVSAAPAGALYEAAVAIPPRRFLDPKGHLAHYQAANIRLQAEFRQWPSCPRVALPRPDIEVLRGGRVGGSGHPAAGVPDVDALSMLLLIGFGVRELTEDGHVKRWTAAAGNIGSTTAYVIVRAPLDGVPPGAYVYLEGDHALARLGALPPDPVSVPPVTVVATANLSKVMRKYGTFGLRLALLDAGCALGAVRDVAEQLGTAFRLVTDWDDGPIADVLGLQLEEEPIASIADLGGSGAL